jgi:Protein of unknown function (DUF2958)
MDMKVEAVKAELAKRLAAYPLYSQEKKKTVQQHMVSAKLYNAFGAGTWYITEYRPETGIAFGYVMGLDHDEWGYIGIDELLEVNHPTGLPAIRLDTWFVPCSFKEVLAAHVPYRAIKVIVLRAS